MILDSVLFLPCLEDSIFIWRWKLVLRIFAILEHCFEDAIRHCFSLCPLQDSLPPSCKNVEIDKTSNACQAIPRFCGNFLISYTEFDAIPRDHILRLVYLLLNWCPGEWKTRVMVIFCIDLQVKLRIPFMFSMEMIIFSFLVLLTNNEITLHLPLYL